MKITIEWHSDRTDEHQKRSCIGESINVDAARAHVDYLIEEEQPSDSRWDFYMVLVNGTPVVWRRNSMDSIWHECNHTEETMSTVVITQHPALVALLIERGIITADTPVLRHVKNSKRPASSWSAPISSPCRSLTTSAPTG